MKLSKHIMNKKEEELVSVGIVSYNNPEGLRLTLDCITRQTYKNLEIILSDDASPNPEVKKVALEFQQKDPRIKYIDHKINGGRFFNFNFTLKEATGEYFMWAADDDSWNEKFIKTCVNKLDNNPQYGLVFPKFELFSDLDKRKVYLNHNWYLKNKYKRILFLLLDECMTHKANLSYGIWRKSVINTVMEKAISYGINEKHMGKGFDNAFLTIALGITNAYQVQKTLFTKQYIGRLIPGSFRSIKRSTINNIKHTIKHPLLHIREMIVNSKYQVDLIEKIYDKPNKKSLKIAFFIKRILYIIRKYIF